MTNRVNWDQYEIALLIEACELEQNNVQPKGNLACDLSRKLRERAAHNGIIVDELFRNENGISLQMTKMKYLLSNGTKGLPGASKAFNAMAVLWKSNRAAFDEILYAAKEQLREGKFELKTMKSTKELFQEWLSGQEKLKLSPERIVRTIEEASRYSLAHSVTKVEFFEITEIEKYNDVCSKLLSQRLFRLMHRQTAQDFEKCKAYYKTFLRDNQELLSAHKEEAAKEKLASKEKAKTSPTSAPADAHETEQKEIAPKETKPASTPAPADTPKPEQKDITPKEVQNPVEDLDVIADKLYIVLKKECELNRYGANLAFLAKRVGTTELTAKKILLSVEWARMEYGRFLFNYSAAQGVFQYNFEKPQSLAFSKPVSVTYFGEIASEAATWKQAFVDLMRVLHDDYPHIIEGLKGKVFDTATIPLVAGVEQADQMRVPREFAEGLYVETKRSAKDILANLKRVVDSCNIDYENIVIKFERKEDLLRPKNSLQSKPVPQGESMLPHAMVGVASTGSSLCAPSAEAYNKWLCEKGGLSSATARVYVTAVRTAEQFAIRKGYANYQIYGSPTEVARSVISRLMNDPEFLRYNQERSCHFSASLRKLYYFMDESSNPAYAEPKAEAQPKTGDQSLPQLFSKLYAASKVYVDPQGMDVSRICSLVQCNNVEKVIDILKNVSWATEVAPGRFSFSRNPVAKAANEVQDFDKDKYVRILLQRFRNGMTFDSIDFDIFRDTYEDSYDERITADDAQLEQRLRQCGVIYKDRLFPAEGIIDNETKEKLYAYIESSFSAGKKVLYYQAIYDDLSDDFAKCFTLSDKDMLKEFIMFTAPNNKYYFFENYMSVEKKVEIDHSAEIAECLLSAGKPMQKTEIYAALSHIPQEKINHIITFDNRFLLNAKGEYFHRDIFEISDSELERIAGYINTCIEENEYAIWTDIWKKIQDEMEIFLENNLYLSSIGVRNAIAKYYAGRFHFNGAVISRNGKNYEMRDIYQLYAKHHTTFSAEDINNLSKELDTVIYFDALSMVCVRVSHDQFVSKKQINFDVDGADRAIGSFMADDYICIREIDSFLAFPGVGYEWNEYLLESFLKSYSKEYVLLNNGFSLNNVAGAIAKKNSSISEFVDACAAVIADGYVELKKDPAINYLAEKNMITRRSYKDIDIALQKAKHLRAQKG